MIDGVGNLMTQIAKCCKPVPGEPIIGYVTLGRGVTVHSRECAHLEQLSKQGRDRFIEVSWGDEEQDQCYPVDIHISSFDRRGLLRDITEILAKCHVNVTAMNTLSNRNNSTADMKLTLEVSGINELSRILAKINQLPNIIDVNRISS
jgi:GTP pyrophosphokinase